MIHSIFIIIRYHKSTQSILPAIYFPNLQHENPLYILNLFEGNKTLDIQKKCFGYNLSNSRHFHDISQVIVSHTLIHHDPSWVHQKFRTRGFSPGPEYVAWDSETVALRKKNIIFHQTLLVTLTCWVSFLFVQGKYWQVTCTH